MKHSSVITGWRRLPAVLAALPLIVLAGVLPAHAAGVNVNSTNGNVVEFGSDVVIKADQVVRGDVVDFGGSIDVHGRVEGSAVTFGGDLHIYPEGAVLKDTVSIGGQIVNDSRTTPASTKRRHGHVAPIGPTVVVPVVPETPAPQETSPPEMGPTHEGSPLEFYVPWAAFVVPDALLTLLAFFLFPLRTRNSEEHLAAQPLGALALGFLAPFFLVFLLIMLVILIVTIPLVPVVLIAFLLAYWIGKAAIASFLGKRILEAMRVADPQPLASVVVGLFLLLVLTGPLWPWFDVTAFFVIAMLAVGTALLSFMRTRPGLLSPQPATSAPAGSMLATVTPPGGQSGPPAVP